MTPIARRPPPAGHRPQRMPIPDTASDRLLIDPYWGTIGALRPHPDIELFGELELLAHLDAGATAIDVRLRALANEGTIPGALSLPVAKLGDHHDLFDDATVACRRPRSATTARVSRAG